MKSEWRIKMISRGLKKEEEKEINRRGEEERIESGTVHTCTSVTTHSSHALYIRTVLYTCMYY